MNSWRIPHRPSEEVARIPYYTVRAVATILVGTARGRDLGVGLIRMTVVVLVCGRVVDCRRDRICYFSHSIKDRKSND